MLKSLSITVLIFASISALAMVLNNTVDEDKKSDIGTNIPTTTTTVCTFMVLPPEKVETSIPKQKVASAPIAHAVSTVIKDETTEQKKDIIQTTDAINGTEGKKVNPDETGDGVEVKNSGANGKELEGLIKTTEPIMTPDVMPSFNLAPFLKKNLRYPEIAKAAGISGKVVVTFIIDEEGNINKATLFKGIGGGCDEEVMRVIRLMPKWNPGMFKGMPVKVSFNQVIDFRLQ
jgi:protein TonB